MLYLIKIYFFISFLKITNSMAISFSASPSEKCNSPFGIDSTTPTMLPQIQIVTKDQYRHLLIERNNGKEIYVDRRIPELTFKCRASYPIQWEFYELPRINDNRRSWTIKFTRIPTTIKESYIFEATLQFQFRPPVCIPLISCVAIDSTNLLESTVQAKKEYKRSNHRTKTYQKLTMSHCEHLDKIKGRRYGENRNCKIGLAYSKVANQVTCWTDFTSLVKRGCSDFASCEGFFNPENKCDYSANFSFIDSSDLIINVNEDLGKYGSGGVLICMKDEQDRRDDRETDQDSAAIHYYTSLLKQCPETRNKDEIPKTYFYGITPKSDGSDMLEMCDLDSKPIYVGEIIEIKCYGSFYYFSYGMQWFFSNGESWVKINETSRETEIPTSDPSEVYYIKSVKAYSVKLKILPEYINFSGVYCFAPKTGSYEWVNKGKSIVVKEPTPIKFKDGINQNASISDGRTLNCSVTGDPSPKLSWDFRELDNSSFVTSGSRRKGRNWISLELQEEAFYLGLTIRCIADRTQRLNGESPFVKTFTLIKPRQIPISLILVPALSIVFAICVCIVLRKLREIHKYPVFTKEERKKIEEMLKHYKHQELSCKYLKKRELVRIARSAFSEVRKATLHDQKTVVKSSLPFSHKLILFMYLKEIERLCQISSVGEHENIIHFVGFIRKHLAQGKAHIVCEYCENIDLLSYLRKVKARFQVGPIHRVIGVTEVLNVQRNECAIYYRIHLIPQLIKWAYQIAEGMKFLHSHNIIHLDLAARNIFVTKDLVCKIGDFGLSYKLETFQNEIVGKVLPIPWRILPSESIQSPYEGSPQSDIYSYGVLLYEIFSLGKIPWEDLDDDTPCLKMTHIANLQRGMVLEKPHLAPEDLYQNIMKRCWDLDKYKRPTFARIVDYLKETYPESATSLYSSGESWLIEEMEKFNSIVT